MSVQVEFTAEELLADHRVAEPLIAGGEQYVAAAVACTGSVGLASSTASWIWERKRDGGFPDVKALKQLVRDRLDPDRDLGHLDRSHRRDMLRRRRDVQDS